MTVVIEPLSDVRPERLAALLIDSERAGQRFVRRLVDEWASGVNRFDRPGEILLAAWRGHELVGVGGLNVDPYAGTARVGRVRHVYVLSTYRRLGIGALLVAEIIDAAQGRFGSLRLRTLNPDAAQLYERLGFRRRDGVAECTHVLEIPRTV
jgi:GNAT superfamily N-acetyltransferase